MKLLHGDCLELMKDIPGGSVDMILCDLPYGVTENCEDVPLDLEKLWVAYKRIIKKNGCIALFCQGKFFVDLVNSNRKWYRYDLVWNKVLKSGFLNAKRMPMRRHEQIAIFYKKKPTYNPQFEQGNPLHGKGTKFLEKEPVDQNYGEYTPIEDRRAGSTEKYPSSILTFQKPHPSKAVHRTEKPVSLLEYLIQTYTNEGDTVLDNCMGSGSTGIACVNTGRHFIGMELNEDYFRIAEDRILKKRQEVHYEISKATDS